MNPLYEALFCYAMEHRALTFLRPNRKEESDNLKMVELAIQKLTDMGPEAEDYAQRIQTGLQIISDLNEEAAFLSGLSIGLELGAFSHAS